jgi:hypothetical protein
VGDRDCEVASDGWMKMERPRTSLQAMFRREALKRRAEMVFVVWRTRKFVSESREGCFGGERELES